MQLTQSGCRQVHYASILILIEISDCDCSASNVPAPLVEGTHYPASVQRPDSTQRFLLLRFISTHRSCNENRPQADFTAKVLDPTLALV